MTVNITIKIKIGKVSKHIEVPDLILRQVPKYGISEEFDGSDPNSEDPILDLEYRLQARLLNKSADKLCDIKYDISYYDSKKVFLGLNKSRLVDEDEMDANDHLPIDIRADIPENTAECIFNVKAKKAGLIGRLFWG